MLSQSLVVSDFSFRPDQKLLQSEEFKRVFDQPDCKVGTPIFLLLARSNGLGRPRIGLVVGKKNARLAVSRNRIKRQVRESFRLWQHRLPSADIIFLARRGADQLPCPEFRQQLENAWSRMRKRMATGEPAQCVS